MAYGEIPTTTIGLDIGLDFFRYYTAYGHAKRG